MNTRGNFFLDALLLSFEYECIIVISLKKNETGKCMYDLKS